MPGLVFRKRLNHRSTQLQKDAALMQYCQHPGAGLEVYQPETMSRKKRKDLWRQFHEKPSIIPGCPGRNHEYGAHDKDTVHQCPQQLTRQTSLCCLTICPRHSCTFKPGTALLKHAMFLCRGQIHLTCIEAMGLATAFKHTVNGRSYLEVHHKVVGSKVPHVLSLKANHPDDAASWLRDMQLRQKVVCGPQCGRASCVCSSAFGRDCTSRMSVTCDCILSWEGCANCRAKMIAIHAAVLGELSTSK